MTVTQTTQPYDVMTTPLEELADPQTEMTLLGAVLINPSSLMTLKLQPEQFSVRRHGSIYRAYQNLFASGREIDIISLTDELELTGQLANIGGPAYLTRIINSVPSSLHAETYARTIEDYAHRRGLLEIANRLAKAAYATHTNIADVESQAISDLVENASVDGAAVPIAEWMNDAYDMLDKASKHPVDMAGIPTGFQDIDAITEGFVPGSVVLIGGIPGIGKTIFMQQLAENITRFGIPGALYSSEMRSRDMNYRSISAGTGLRVSDMRRGVIPAEKWADIAHRVESVSGLPLFVSDSNRWTTASLRADLTRLKYEHGIKWFAFDYLELMRDTYGDNESERATYLGRHLTWICQELDLVGFVIQKLVKSGFEGVPDLHHFGGGSSLPYDVGYAIVLTKHIPEDEDAKPNPNVVTGIIRKGRFLETSTRIFHLWKHADRPAFASWTAYDLNEESRR